MNKKFLSSIYFSIIILYFVPFTFSYYINIAKEKKTIDEDTEIISFHGINNKFIEFYNITQHAIEVQNTSTTTSVEFNEKFYNQLNNYEKDIYDRLYRISNETLPKLGIQIIYKYKISSDNFNFDKIISCLILDNPQFWWISFYDASVAYKTVDEVPNTNVTIKLISNKYNIFTGTSVDTIIGINSEIKECKNNLVNQINELNLTSDYDILKYIHDYLVSTVVYTSYSDDPHIYTLYGALVKKESVAEGYSEAFKYIADQFGLHVIIARSNSHQWNLAEINGKWYAIDVTKDDPMQRKIYIDEETNDTIIELYYPESGDDSNLTYDYFLIGSETEINNVKYSENRDFVLVYSVFSSKDELIVYPEIEKKAYDINSDTETIIKTITTTSSSSSTITTTITTTPESSPPTTTIDIPESMTTTTTTTTSESITNTDKNNEETTVLLTPITETEEKTPIEEATTTIYDENDDSNMNQEYNTTKSDNTSSGNNKVEYSVTSYTIVISILTIILSLLFI